MPDSVANHQPLLAVQNLAVSFTRAGEARQAVRDVSFQMAPGERAALVGESGCGKSVTCLALTRLPPTDRATINGRGVFAGTDLLTLPAGALRAVRGAGLAYVFQDPVGSLNPVMRIGAQVMECLAGPRRQARDAAAALLARVGLPDPVSRLRSYPCELSGGMQQRVMLAMALAARPRLLVADEPTTALDVTTQQKVLDLVDTLAAETGMAVLLVTHNLGLVAGRARQVHVLYAGQVVESGPVATVLRHPAHPYTVGLRAAVPRLDAPPGELRDIPGTVPDPADLPPGCAFAPRCACARSHCAENPPLAPLPGEPDHLVRCWRASGAHA